MCQLGRHNPATETAIKGKSVSVAFMEFLLVVLAGVIIVGVVIEVAKIIDERAEERREEEASRQRVRRWLREEAEKNKEN